MSILVTGGAGYIGSHTCVELLNAGYEITVVDNLYNSSPKSLDRVKELTGKDFKFYECDIRDTDGMDKIFKENKIDAVIHFAGLKAVGESCEKPLEYYDNNIGGTLKLCEVMRNNNCKNIVFSSSATVYGMNNISPLKETMKTGGTTNPYGTTKYMIEIILEDLCKADSEWNVTLLRYFNPIGAHKSGRIGENPNGIPNNLMPYITQVAIGKREFLSVYGDDYDTHDGTGVRDYIHVVDLAKGHVKALERIEKDVISGNGMMRIYNLGTGIGYSVFDIIQAFSKVCGRRLPYRVEERRTGDIDACYADARKAQRELGWQAEFDLERMCKDAYRWQVMNPNGYVI